MKLVSIEQRRQMQCLNLLYRLSKKKEYIKQPNVYSLRVEMWRLIQADVLMF